MPLPAVVSKRVLLINLDLAVGLSTLLPGHFANAQRFLASLLQAAALVSARIVIATDGHPDVIAALKENLALNGFLDTTDAGPGQSPAPSSPGMGAAVPVHTCRLRWGESADMVAVRALAGPVRICDVIIQLS